MSGIQSPCPLFPTCLLTSPTITQISPSLSAQPVAKLSHETVTPSSELTVKAHKLPSLQPCGIPWEPGAIPIIHNTPPHTQYLAHRRHSINVRWMRIMLVHCSDHPSREPTGGSTVDLQPPAALPSNPLWSSCWGYISPGFSQSVTKHAGGGGWYKTQLLLSDAGYPRRPPLPGDSLLAWPRHFQNCTAVWNLPTPASYVPLPFPSCSICIRIWRPSFPFLPPPSFTQAFLLKG